MDTRPSSPGKTGRLTTKKPVAAEALCVCQEGDRKCVPNDVMRYMWPWTVQDGSSMKQGHQMSMDTEYKKLRVCEGPSWVRPRQTQRGI